MRRIWKVICVAAAIAVIAAVSVSFAVDNSPKVQKDKPGNTITLYVGSPTALINNAETKVDKDNPDIMPLTKNNRTMVPVRFVAENLGLNVKWDASTSSVSIENGSKNIKLVLGSSEMTVGSSRVMLEASAESINGRTFLPLRALVEAVGKKVFYDRGLIVISDNESIYNASTDKVKLDGIIALINKPPVIESMDKLRTFLKNTYADSQFIRHRWSENTADAVEVAPAMKNESMKNAKADEKTFSGSNDYSQTNVQVQGVDEADVVKTDGEYIYQVNNQKIIVAKAYPGDSMEITSSISFERKDFNPQEIYVDSKYMVAIGNSNSKIELGSNAQQKCPPYEFSTAKAVVFDITDKKNIKQIREVELEGNYISSRKIGSTLYIVSNKNIDYLIGERIYDKDYIENNYKDELKQYGKEEVNKYIECALVPSYRDTAQGDGFKQVDCKKISYFPDAVQPNYMNVAALNLDKPDQKVNLSSYLGAGQNIYASEQNLYVSVTKRNRNIFMNEKRAVPMEGGSISSVLYKFSLTQDAATYLCKGEVPGNILNQFSMDENGKYFRIATTNSYPKLANNVYVLDETLNITGKLTDIAPDEKIYSVRFMGEKAYVVTFKTVDPLFVIGFKDGEDPKILGQLKIPGFSDYLHPYDENHIIGFGKDTIEKDGRAYYLGMKLALFDVTDVANPKQLFTEKIGDRGTDSELLRNHKALLFSKTKNLLAFPVNLMEVKENMKSQDDSLNYGQPTFQGAYIYNIDLVNGFKLKGKITHMQDGQNDEEKYGYSGERYIDRILYINDTLYTLSKGMIKANTIEDLKEKRTLIIP